MLLNSCVRLFQRLNLSNFTSTFNHLKPSVMKMQSKYIHLSAVHSNSNLMEFFDDKKNWGQSEVKCGRSWRLGELRNKSNQDLHKLWYILLKESNMLLTMEEFCKERYILFPSPERIDKVQESMKNVETVIRERNKAYFQLETGEDGERPGAMIHTAIGLPVYHKMTQHVVPKYRNKWWKNTFLHGFDWNEASMFLKKYYEKKNRIKRKIHRNRKNYAHGLLTRFKNIDMDHLRELYPDVKLPKNGKPEDVRGHWNS